MTKTRDRDKQAVYHAENMVFSETLFDEGLSDRDIQSLADSLFGSDWWQGHRIPVPELSLRRVDADHSVAHIYPAWSGIPPQIRFCVEQVNPWILAHEAAHIAQGHFYNQEFNPHVETHGREFRAAYLVVAEILLGHEAAHRLRLSFDTYVKQRPEHAPGQPGWILTLPHSRYRENENPEGIFPEWRMKRQIEEMAKLTKMYEPFTPNPNRIGGAIAL